jgi:pimeloyl-ACP methyl ester carboxylesterase
MKDDSSCVSFFDRSHIEKFATAFRAAGFRVIGLGCAFQPQDHERQHGRNQMARGCRVVVMVAGTTVRIIAARLVLVGICVAQERVSFPTEDGGLVYADVYGKGDRGVVLAHGGRFTKESWEKQARVLEKAGFRAVAIDFRGRAQSRGGTRLRPGDEGFRFDVLAAVRYLQRTGAKTVSVVGASFGGDAAAGASMEAEPGEIDRIVLLAAWTDTPEKLKGRKLFIVARDDANDDGLRLPKIRANYEQAGEPKKLVVLEGSAHAQFLFEIEQGERVMGEILKFLSEP